MNTTTNRLKAGVSNPLITICVALLLVLLIRTIFAVNFLEYGGDSDAYKTVALNIAENACISLSEPESRRCLPHWGGNQLPGFPALIAASYILFGISDVSTVVLMNMLFGVSLARLCVVLISLGLGTKRTVLLVLIIGLSPLHLGYARFILTEQAAIIVSIWLCAEILAAGQGTRRRTFYLAIISSIAFLIRYDAVALIPPLVLFVTQRGGSIKKAYVEILKLCIVFSLLLLAITARHVVSGLAVIPQPSYVKGTSEIPTGYVNWAKTWMFKSQHQEAVLYPIAEKNYSAIYIPESAQINLSCRSYSKSLLNQLSRHEGDFVPAALDREFDRLSVSDCRPSLNQYFKLLAYRSVFLWLNLPASFGLPTSENGLTQNLKYKFKKLAEEKSIEQLLVLHSVIKNNFAAIFARGLANLYWCSLLMVAGFVAVRNQHVEPRTTCLMKFGIFLALTKTILLVFVIQTTFETRLLASVVPFLEIPAWLYILKRRSA